MHEIDMKKFNVRTDLVVDILDESIVKDEYNHGDIKVTDITLDENNILNKKKGRYITISFNDVTDKDNRKKVEEVFIDNLHKLLGDISNKKFLIVGLGNIKSTPDSLGPKVIDNILVTRYLYETPGIDVDENYSNVSAIIPGVSGTTGIESTDIILGMIDKIKADIVIAIDALASSSIDRINKTIQMTDTGIEPGSGVGNKRKELSYDTLNVKTIAIGIPTVIDGVTIVADTIEFMKKKFSYSKDTLNKKSEKFVLNRNYKDTLDNLTEEEKEKLLGVIGNLTDEEIKQLIFEVLSPIDYNLMVTVKEIDFVIDKLILLLSNGINKTLHKNYNE